MVPECISNKFIKGIKSDEPNTLWVLISGLCKEYCKQKLNYSGR